MFNRSSAFIICANSAWTKSCNSVLSEIGFAHIEHITDAKALALVPFSRPLQFCFITPASDQNELKRVMRAIRGHNLDKHRFSPMIMLARSLSRRQIDDYIGLGMDDIVQFPCSLKFMGDRLKRQLCRPLKYFETDTYFGPDRRRDAEREVDHQERRKGEADYRQYLIQRDPFEGVRMLDIYDHQAAQLAGTEAEAS
ncbi:hypothetical protein MXMO3_00734 [Maritalea myrionectae]|uniref:Response regulatory domain-containing protein n=1 Tax=Maritalea myrionectae TaxID=454601 RepID=A0A2R4MBK4_9HYPH|nr:hypothetical protein [Maritalea myrionectae]AVX03266.1 hypothetical protein MXMO3_00734 [Maritalea myrionectae]